MARPFNYQTRVYRVIPLHFVPPTPLSRENAKTNIYRFPKGYFTKRRYPRTSEIKKFDDNYVPLENIPSAQ